jgi:hypothetical protein
MNEVVAEEEVAGLGGRPASMSVGMALGGPGTRVYACGLEAPSVLGRVWGIEPGIGAFTHRGVAPWVVAGSAWPW